MGLIQTYEPKAELDVVKAAMNIPCSDCLTEVREDQDGHAIAPNEAVSVCPGCRQPICADHRIYDDGRCLWCLKEREEK